MNTPLLIKGIKYYYKICSACTKNSTVIEDLETQYSENSCKIIVKPKLKNIKGNFVDHHWSCKSI